MFLKNIFPLFFFATALLFTSCSDDDQESTSIVNPNGHLEVRNHPVMQGVVTINVVYVSNDSWIIIYRDNEGEQGTEILGYTRVKAGGHNQVAIPIASNSNVTIGETLWAALHVDGDEDGVLDWDGNSGVDEAIEGQSGIVSKAFTITRGNSVIAHDQAVVDNSITISNVHLDYEGWVYIYPNDNYFEELIGKSKLLPAGNHDNVVITFMKSAKVNVGDRLWIRLAIKTTGAMWSDYEWAIGNDGNPVKISITITE